MPTFDATPCSAVFLFAAWARLLTFFFALIRLYGDMVAAMRGNVALFETRHMTLYGDRGGERVDITQEWKFRMKLQAYKLQAKHTDNPVPRFCPGCYTMSISFCGTKRPTVLPLRLRARVLLGGCHVHRG
jgi:hypothetical protein